jgi:hypothetical protein
MAMMVANGLKSRSEYISEMGGSFEQTAKLLQHEEEVFKELDINVGIGQPGQTLISQVDAEAEEQKGGRPTRDEDDDPDNDSDKMSAEGDWFWHNGRVYCHDDEGVLRPYDPTA